MRYVQLRAFHYVAICSGFSRAAEALHLTQPAISDQVRKLETDYDIRLFDRSKKQISLTQHGKKLLELTHRLFEIEEKAAEFLDSERVLRTGRLNIILDSPQHILPKLALFRNKYPEVFVSIRVGNSSQVKQELISYNADIGVLGEIPESREFDTIPLSSTPIIAFAKADGPFANLPSVTIKQLAKMPLVLREHGSQTRAKLVDYSAKKGISLNAHIEAEGREAVRDLVLHGGGIGIVSESEFFNHPDLIKIPISDARLMMEEAVITLKERSDSKLIRTFLPFVKS